MRKNCGLSQGRLLDVIFGGGVAQIGRVTSWGLWISISWVTVGQMTIVPIMTDDDPMGQGVKKGAWVPLLMQGPLGTSHE